MGLISNSNGRSNPARRFSFRQLRRRSAFFYYEIEISVEPFKQQLILHNKLALDLYNYLFKIPLKLRFQLNSENNVNLFGVVNYFEFIIALNAHYSKSG